ncbi:MAG: thioredoxin family protein [Chloroflexi bacterium]|nr:thioredoxin family protein [Chloroflexota bacterium]
MGTFVNQYSFLLLSMALLLVAGLILLTRKPKWNDYLAFAVILGGLVLAWSVLHPRQTTLMNGSREVLEMIGNGTPVLLEFQSPYCMACTAIQPAVDALEKELDGQLKVIRLNIQDPIGRELTAVYGFSFTPTFILIDGGGNEIDRQVGTLDPQRVRDALK